jgi:hypothetical protein
VITMGMMVIVITATARQRRRHGGLSINPT